ncbi:hypothetical protein JCM9279_002673 [Rhodotorula babjevae]
MLHFSYEGPEDRRLACAQPSYLHRVEIRTSDQFNSFRCTVENQPAVRELAVDLSVSIPDEGSDTAEDDGDGVGQSHAGPVETGELSAHWDEVGRIISPRALAAVLSCLHRVEVLKLDGIRPAGLAVVLGETDPRSLASIKRLEVESAEVDQVDPDDDEDIVADERVCLDRLARLPALESLSIAQNRPGAQILPTLQVPLSFPQVTRLSFTGTVLKETWAGPALHTLVPHVVDLTVADFSPVAWFASLLDTAPTGLRKLSMSEATGVSIDVAATNPIDGVLPRFEHLEDLSVCGGVFSDDLDSRLACLRRVRCLRSLHLVGPIATDALLAGLLDDPRHLPRLERLALSHVGGGVKGSTVAEMGGAPGLVDADWLSRPLWQGWSEPEYPSGCTEAGLRTAVAVAEARAIVVEGSALGALAWHVAFAAEQRVALLVHGDSTGDYGLARQVLGDAVVDEHVVERSLAQLERLGVVDGTMDVDM